MSCEVGSSILLVSVLTVLAALDLRKTAPYAACSVTELLGFAAPACLTSSCDVRRAPTRADMSICLKPGERCYLLSSALPLLCHRGKQSFVLLQEF